jgi:hypothetical protein
VNTELEAAIHKAIAPHLTKRQQGYVMGAIRDALAIAEAAKTAPETEDAEWCKAAEDMRLTGTAFMRDGKRIDPRNVYLSTPAAAPAPVEWGYCCYGGPARQRACWSCAAWKPVASAPGLVMGNPISAAPVDGMAEIRWVIGGKVLGQPTGMDALEYANARIYPDSASDVRLPKLDKLRELFATPTSAPTPDRATPGERYTVVDSLVSELWNVTLRREYRTPGEKKRAIRAAIENELTQPIASSEAAQNSRSCTCHPSERPHPCQHKYAFSECVEAAHGEQDYSADQMREARNTWFAWTQVLAAAQEVAPEEFSSKVAGTNVDRILRVIRRQPAAAPGAVDDAMVERVAMAIYMARFGYSDEVVAKRWAETERQAEFRRRATAALATKPDGARAGGGES